MYLSVNQDGSFGFKDVNINEILSTDVLISDDIYNQFFTNQGQGKQYKIKNINGKTFSDIFAEIVLTLQEVQISKITEMTAICDSKNISGFTSSCLGVAKVFDSDLISQSRINGLCNIAQLRLSNLTTEIIKWRSANEIVCYEFTPQQMLTLALDLKRFVEANTDILEALTVYISDTKRTIEEVQAVTWNMIIPS